MHDTRKGRHIGVVAAAIRPLLVGGVGRIDIAAGAVGGAHVAGCRGCALRPRLALGRVAGMRGGCCAAHQSMPVASDAER